jgi:tyrosyl-tRNA synthetase
MSKSLGNYIGVAELPSEMFGKIMSISDELMLRYYELLTREDVAALKAALGNGSAHPMELKKRLGEILVARFHGADASTAARSGFEERFQERHLDTSKLDEFVVEDSGAKLSLPHVMRAAGLVASTSEARRLIKQKAVRLDGAAVISEEVERPGAGEATLEVGKRRAVRLRFR